MNNTHDDSAPQGPNLSSLERALLAQIYESRKADGYPRPRKTPARDRLQRLGLVESARPHSLRNHQTRYWHLTAAGVALAEAGQ